MLQLPSPTKALFTKNLEASNLIDKMEKKVRNAMSDVSSLRSILILQQGNAEKPEELLAKSTPDLAGDCIRADGAVRKRIE